MKRLLLLLLTIVLLMCSCNKIIYQEEENTKLYKEFNTKIENSDNIDYLSVAMEENTISYCILNSEGLVETDGCYFLKENETFERFIHVLNNLGSDLYFKLLVFSNYQQTEFLVDGQLVDSCDFFIENKKALQIPIELVSLKEGYNDIIFLIMINTKDDLSYEERDTLSCVSNRCTVYSGNKDIPPLEIVDYPTIQENEETYITIHEEQERPDIPLIISNTEINKPFQFYITLDNLEEEYSKFVILLLVDWEQKKIQGQDVFLVEIPIGSRITIPIQLVFDSPGTHEVMAVQVCNPYIEYDFLSDHIFATNRAGVEVD